MAGLTHDKLLPVARYDLCKKIIKWPLVKCEDIHPGSMIFIHGIDNNILNYGAIFYRIYQEESKIQEI